MHSIPIFKFRNSNLVLLASKYDWISHECICKILILIINCLNIIKIVKNHQENI